MAWTTPRTWSPGETVTASLMNTHIRDNLNVLKTPIDDNGKIRALNSTYLASLDGSALTNLTVRTPSFFRTTSNFTKNSNTTLSDVTGLAFAVAAGKTYAFVLYIMHTGAGAADWKATFTGPASPTSIVFLNTSFQTTGGPAVAFGTQIDWPTSAAPNAQTETIHGYLVNGANAGTVQFQAAQLVSTGSNSIIYSGSWGIVWPVD